MEKKYKSFRMTSIHQPTDSDKKLKWWQFTKMGRRELGQTAIIGILAGYFVSMDGYFIGYIFGPLLSGIGLASALMWLYKVIRRQ